MVRRAAGLVVAVLCAASCGGQSASPRGAPEPARSSSAAVLQEQSVLVAAGVQAGDPDGFALPDFVVTEPGVARSARVLERLEDLPAGWPDGASLSLASCTLAGPGRWLLSGSLEGVVPAGSLPLVWTLFSGDVGGSVPLSVDVTGPGAFTIGLDLLDQRLASSDFVAGSCELTDRAHGQPATRATVATSRSDAPLSWDAPAGTLQAAGVGASLDPADNRLGWAYLNWRRTALPFGEVWLPADLRDARLQWTGPFEAESSGCTSLTYQTSLATVTHENGCLTAFPTAGATVGGWQLLANAPGASLTTDEMTVTVFPALETDLEAALASLHPVENRRVSPAAPQPALDADVFIDRTIAELPGTLIVDARERARIAVDAGFVVVAIGNRPGVPVGQVVWATAVTHTGNSWSGGGGQGVEYDGCAAVLPAPGTDGGLHLVVVLADPAWLLQTLTPGGWVDLPTVDGVWYDPAAVVPPDVLPTPNLRALADGQPVPCPGLQP